jgi:hypothetical protein
VAHWPADFEPVGRRNLARTEFLHAIERVTPEVLLDLFETVLPEFQDLLEQEGLTPDQFNSAEVRDPMTRLMRSGGANRTIRNSYFVVLNSLRPHVDTWGARFCLLEPPRRTRRGRSIDSSMDPAGFYWAIRHGDVPLLAWMMPVIGDTLGTWAVGDAQTPLRWCLDRAGERRPRLGTRPPLRVTVSGWSLDAETAKAFADRVRREVNETLAEYVRHAEAALAAGPAGGSETEITLQLPCHANPENTLTLPTGLVGRIFPDLRVQRACRVSARYTPEHYDWLVKFQVQRKRWGTIVKEACERVAPEAVKMAVQQAAEAVCGREWYTDWLRKGAPGRPPKG